MSFKLLQVNVFVVLLLLSSPAWSQNILLSNAYAHNDYWHKKPLHTALNNGFTYIEADVILLGKKLIVAHTFPFFKKKRTLEALYLRPLLEYVTANENKLSPAKNDPITLVIDIKTNANNTYRELEKLLEKYRNILSVYKDGQLVVKNVTIVITGHKPLRLIEASNEHLAFIDEDLRTTGKDTVREIYPIASCKYSSLLKWRGKGALPADEMQRLQLYVKQAHELGRKVRLWASPENTIVWEQLLECKVDLINTDRITALHDFLIDRLSLMAVVK